MRVHVVDPSAYTPPYDHALCTALAAAGAQVQLHTSRFAYAALAPPGGYERHEDFYRRATQIGNARARRLVKLAEHVPDMLSYRARARAPDVVHFQWLPVQQLDRHLLPRGRPLVLTAHDILPREALPGQRAAQRRLYERVDAVVVHSEHGARRLTDELGLPAERVHVIAHGLLRPWEGQPARPLPAELAGAEGPVALFFGLLRPYKGLDVLLDAWAGVERGELWVVGMPRMDTGALRARATRGVRWLQRFVSDGEMHAIMRRADLLVAPYREIESSGVVFTALGAGLPVLASDVGGLSELTSTGAVQVTPPGDAAALREALIDLLETPERLREMALAASHAGDGGRSWSAIATRTLELYASLFQV